MRFPAFFASLRRLGRWGLLEGCELLLWAGAGLGLPAAWRSAWRGGGPNRPPCPVVPPVRPRRLPGLGGGAGRLPYVAAA